MSTLIRLLGLEGSKESAKPALGLLEGGVNRLAWDSYSSISVGSLLAAYLT